MNPGDLISEFPEHHSLMTAMLGKSVSEKILNPPPVDANGPRLSEVRRSPSTMPLYKEPSRRTPAASRAALADMLGPAEPAAPNGRPAVKGKFIFADGEKLFVRGVTYGPFTPAEDGGLYHAPAAVAADFAAIARLGANAVRTYTVPPRWLLDVAADNGLRVMVGFGWEQHITFLDERKRRNAIEEKVR